MSVRQLAAYDDRVLTRGARRVPEVNDDICRLIDDMIDTMREGERSGVGLAAPQVGEPHAIIVAQPPPDHEGVEALYRGAIVLVNPEIVVATGTPVAIEEGCLSCPGVTAEVERAASVIVKGLDRDGKAVRLEVSGALARIFQHEIDHLNGKFFFDRLNPLKRQLVKARIRRT